MTYITAAEARKHFGRLVSQTAYAKERFVVTKHNSEMAALISMDELRLLDALRERFREEPEIQAMERAIAESRDRIEAVEFLEAACEETVLTQESFDRVVDLVASRPKATAGLRDLVKKHADQATTGV